LDGDVGEVRGAEPLAGVEDLNAHDVAVLIHIHRDPLLDVNVVVGMGLTNLDVQRVRLGVVLDLHRSPRLLGGCKVSRMRSSPVRCRRIRFGAWRVIRIGFTAESYRKSTLCSAGEGISSAGDLAGRE